MELTLTGASLTSNKPPPPQKKKKTLAAAEEASSLTEAAAADAKNCQKKCCENHHDTSTTPKVPSNYQPVQSIPKEKLTANPKLLFQALVQSIKTGSYDTFLYLCNLVTDHEMTLRADRGGGENPIMNWGQRNEEVLLRESGHVVKDADLTKDCRTALGRRTEEGHSLAHWAAKQAKDIRFMQHLASIPTLSLHLPSTDKVGMRPLHWAATEGSIPLVALILSHLDAPSDNSTRSSSTTTNNNNTHSHTTSHHHHTSSLVHRSDPINCRDLSGCTPLLIASQYGHADLAAFLIKRGADPNAVDDARDTALHWGAYKGSIPVCGLLLHLNGIRNHLDQCDSFGQSPLHLASLRGNTDVVAYLLDQAEAFVEPMNSSTTTSSGSSSPVDPHSGYMYTAKLLTATDRDGKTPIALAKKKKQMAAEVLLRNAMKQYVTNPSSSRNSSTLTRGVCAVWTLIQQAFSYKSWLVGLGLIQDVNGSRPPKSIFWFVISQLILATFVELVIYVPLLGDASRGRLWDWMWLHTTTLFFLGCTWMNFILVHITNPGVLGGGGGSSGRSGSSSRASSSSSSSSSNSSSTSSGLLTCDENTKIGRDMHTLTLELRKQYDETLERWATNPPTSSNQDNVQLCHSCRIVKPLRSKHCRALGKCVLLFDHHCPFVGTTIGLYNYKYFYLFVTSMTLAEIFFTMTGIIHLRRGSSPEGGGGGGSQGFEWGLFVCALWLSLFLLMAGGLALYHTQLIMRNLTTNEHQNQFRYHYLKDSFGRFWNPFERGFVNNFMSRFLPGKESYMLVGGSGGEREGARNANGQPKLSEQERQRLVHNAV